MCAAVLEPPCSADPNVEYTTVTLQTIAFATFMKKVDRIERRAARWQDMFFEESHDVAGS
jgi:hypothetical protein